MQVLAGQVRFSTSITSLFDYCTSLTHNESMIFIETPLFTKLIQDLMPDEDYRFLQQTFLMRPGTEDLIRGSGGLRKIRWNMPETGKRGGVRIVYYWDVQGEVIYLLLPYRKNKQEDLTPEQIMILRGLIKEGLQ